MVEHCEEESLALMALGEAGDPRDDAHVQQCSRCQSRLDQLAAVVSVTRSLTPDDRPQSPPDDVWTGIASELGISGAGVSGAGSSGAGSSGAGAVASLDAARRRRSGRGTLLVAAAAVVGIALGSLVTVGALRSTPAPQVVAEASLAPVADSGLRGTASVQQVDGQSVLVVSVPELTGAKQGYYEVWMATPDTSTMVAMGTLNAGHEGRFPLPDGLDPSAFPVVDVSVEQFDGDNTHSPTSILRGQLGA